MSIMFSVLATEKKTTFDSFTFVKYTRSIATGLIIAGSTSIPISLGMMSASQLTYIEYEYKYVYGQSGIVSYFDVPDLTLSEWYQLYQGLDYGSIALLAVGTTLDVVGIGLLISSVIIENKMKRNWTGTKKKYPSIENSLIVSGISMMVPSGLFLGVSILAQGWIGYARQNHNFYGVDKRIYLPSLISSIAYSATQFLTGISLVVVGAVLKQRNRKKVSVLPYIATGTNEQLILGIGIRF